MKLLLCFFLLSAVTAEPNIYSEESCLRDVSLTNLMKSSGPFPMTQNPDTSVQHWMKDARVCQEARNSLAFYTHTQITASTILENAKIVCDDFKQNGAYSSCPSDYTATACSCGFGCGSWDIQPENKCHCQCAGMDWTLARCCKIASK